MIEIVNYSPTYEKQHFEFATRMFGKRRKRRNPDYVYWKFRGEPGKELPSFKLAVEKGEIIGQLGLIPCFLKVETNSIATQWACDLMVDPAYRGKGIAKLLYEAAHQQKPVTLGSDPSPSAEKSMLRSGYKKLNSSTKQFIPIYFGVPLQMKGLPHQFLKSVKNPFLSVYRQKKYKREFQQLDIINENHYELFPTPSKKDLRIEVDPSFKNWRFSAFKDYYPGISLYQLKSTNTYFSGYYHGHIYFITDLALEEESHFYAIINFIMTLLPKHVDRIRFQNNIHSKKLGSQLTTIEYSTKTSIIYYTKDEVLEKSIQNKYFYYTHQDSDENI